MVGSGGVRVLGVWGRMIRSIGARGRNGVMEGEGVGCGGGVSADGAEEEEATESHGGGNGDKGLETLVAERGRRLKPLVEKTLC